MILETYFFNCLTQNKEKLLKNKYNLSSFISLGIMKLVKPFFLINGV